MAYVLGYLLADGAIEDVRQSSRTCYIQFTSIDKGLLGQVKEVMGSNHTLYVEPAHDMHIHGKTYYAKESYRLRIGNKIMFQDLALLGLAPKKAERISIPKMNEELFIYFLRGYFDGDGCVNLYVGRNRTKGQLTVIFTSCCQDFLTDIHRRLASTLGLENRGTYFQKYAYRLTYKGKKALKLLKYMYQNLYDAPFLERKYRIYNNFG